MTNINIESNDPRLTDYVLGELDVDQRAEVEKLLETSPEARAAVDELRAISGLLTESFKTQPSPALTGEQRAAVVAAAVASKPEPAKSQPAKPKSRAWRLVVVLTTVTVCIAAIGLAVVRLTGSPQTSARFTDSDLKSGNLATNFTADMSLASESMDGDGVVVDRNSATVVTSSVSSGDSPLWDQTSAASRPRSFSKSDENEAVRRIKLSETRLRGSHYYSRDTQTSPQIAQDSNRNGDGDSNEAGKPTAGPEGRFVVNKGRQVSGSTEGYVDQSGDAGGPALPQKDSWPKGGSVVGHSTPGQFTKDGKSDGEKSEAAPVDFSAADGAVRFSSENINYNDNTSLGVQGQYQNLADRRDRRVVADAFADRDGAFLAGTESRNGETETSGESYDAIVENAFCMPTTAPLSTFSIDVDTASYSNVRRFLSTGQRPPKDSVRIEELVNYFRYEDVAPTDGRPFAVRMEVAACPWEADHRLVRIALKGKEISKSQRPGTNLVFLLDVSGSMRDDNKLPLLKQAMKVLVGEMTENDRIAIVTYAGDAGLVLDSTSGDKKDVILKAIDSLDANGSTNGEAGIKLAYSTAVSHLYKEGSNRVILCTDGDFNVGVSDDEELVQLIQQQARDSQVFLSIFGFGMGNLKDAKLEKLADKGNGHYGYVDNLREAKKLFVEDLTGTLYTIAKDVKLQIEFNPAKVGAYRLVGYENRVMPNQDFNDDTKDAGEIGAGHSVVALYEIVPVDKMPVVASRPELKYQSPPATPPADAPKPEVKPSDELLTVSLRYKQPDAATSEKLEFPLGDKPGESTQGSRDFQWTSAVATFGMLLRESQYRGQASFAMVLELAQASSAGDEEGRRAEFIEMVKAARNLYEPAPTSPTPPATPAPR